MIPKEVSDSLAELGRDFHARGWSLGTSGNFSAVTAREPLRMALTVSGVDKGKLTSEQILVIDENQNVVEGTGRPSAEARLHLTVARLKGAGAVLHTHSVWSNILAEACGGALVNRCVKKFRQQQPSTTPLPCLHLQIERPGEPLASAPVR